MFLSKFSAMIFTLLVAFGGKNAGNSPYSFEVSPACGLNPSSPTCEVKPVCDAIGWRCAPPRWSKSRQAWVVPETKEAALRRYEKIADAIAKVSFLHARCRDENGSLVEECQPSGWPEGPRSLAMVAATTALYESGLREDIMKGLPPMGRGPLGESCLMQVMPAQIRQFASWIPEEEAKEYDKLPFGKARSEMDEKWAQMMVGEDAESLYRCFDVGLRALARARRACAGKPVGAWHYKMWALYGTGQRCSLSDPESFAAKRSGTFLRMKHYIPKISREPEQVGEPKTASN